MPSKIISEETSKSTSRNQSRRNNQSEKTAYAALHKNQSEQTASLERTPQMYARKTLVKNK